MKGSAHRKRNNLARPVLPHGIDGGQHPSLGSRNHDLPRGIDVGHFHHTFGFHRPADLLDPDLNVEFAAWYLTSLMERFDGHLPLAIAAYNGGPHNVRRWIQEGAADAPLDVLLERIPFTQTHRYVRKVLVHYEAYRKQRELPTPQLSVHLPEQRIDPLAF